MIRLIYLCFLFFISVNGYSQLHRKALFGARIEYVTENGNSGCKVVQVVRGTSVELKLQENDLITNIGNLRSFIILRPGPSDIKLFTSVTYEFS